MNLPLPVESGFFAAPAPRYAYALSAESLIGIRVLRQLLEALLSEGVLRYRCEPADRPGRYRICCQTGNGEWSYYGRIAAFGRVRLEAESLSPYTERLEELLSSLPMGLEALEKLRDELAQTVRFCLWNHQHLGLRRPRRELDFAALESALDEGHPYHPCFKARTGFSATDHYRYGPEAGQCFQLHWLAVRADRMRLQLPEPAAAFWRRELGADCYALLNKRLQQQTDHEQEYCLLPIHPWQWQNLMQSLLPQVRADAGMLYLGEAGDNYSASQSVRTLINVSNPGKAHVKLSMNMVNTSSLRTLEPNSVCSAPVLCDWLQQVVSSDAFFHEQQVLLLLPEYAGMTYEGPEAPHLQGQLAAIWRADIKQYLQTGEQAVPFTALLAVESDGLPFIDPWVEQQGVENWLHRLFEVVVLPVWHLLVAQGIAIEAHGQNLILLHRGGQPSRLAVRDFHESVEYVPEFLAQPKLCPDFLPLNPCYAKAQADEFYWMERVEALRELYMDTLYIYNLSELAHLLQGHYGYGEADFWQLLAGVLEDYERAGFTDPARIRRVGAQAEQVKTESLVRRKLRYPHPGECHHWVANPLAGPCLDNP